jgi:hypothetical protein
MRIAAGNEILFSAKPSESQQSAVFVVPRTAAGCGRSRFRVAAPAPVATSLSGPWMGKKIAFTMFVPQTGLSDLYRVNPDGTGLYQVAALGLGRGPDELGHASADPLGRRRRP